MAPVTWLFGPVVAVNVILTASPVLSALAMFALVRRWVSWMPAACLAGLFYGFSPFVVNNLGVAHVDFVMIAIPPLVVLCLDELLIRQQRRPAVVGIIMGLLISAQFFVGVEILTLMIIEAAIGIVMIVVYTAVRNPTTLRKHAGHAATGGVAAILTAAVLLALPAWFALAGPAHFSPVTHPGVQLTEYSASISDAVFASSRRENPTVATHRGWLPGSSALRSVLWPRGGPCLPGRAHYLVEGPALVAVWSSVRRHAAPRHIVRILACPVSALKERVPRSLRSFCVSGSFSRPGSHHGPYAVSDSSTWRENKRGFEWTLVQVAGGLLSVERSSRRPLGGRCGNGPTRCIPGEEHSNDSRADRSPHLVSCGGT